MNQLYLGDNHLYTWEDFRRTKLHEGENIVQIHIQYWCIDGKYTIYLSRIKNEGKTSRILYLPSIHQY